MLPRQQAPQSRSTGEQKTWAGLQENPNSFIAFKVNTDVNVTLFLFAPIFLFYLHNRPYLKKKKKPRWRPVRLFGVCRGCEMISRCWILVPAISGTDSVKRKEHLLHCPLAPMTSQKRCKCTNVSFPKFNNLFSEHPFESKTDSGECVTNTAYSF